MKKNRVVYTLIFFFLLQIAFSQSVRQKIAEADSLYQSQKFTEAFDVYNKVLKEEQLVSHKMLLKMAYIKEGLGDFMNALYYLNLYYYQSQDKRVLSKINELALANDLSGYRTDDSTYILNFFNTYRRAIVLVLFFMAIGLMTHVAVVKFFLSKRNEQMSFPGLSLALSIFFCALLLVLGNVNFESGKCLVTSNHTLLMKSPSSGGELLTVINKGHKLSLLSKGEIWSRASWNGEEVYVRTKNIRPI